MTTNTVLVPVLVPTVAGEVHNELTPEQYARHRAKYGDAFLRWMTPQEAKAMENKE